MCEANIDYFMVDRCLLRKLGELKDKADTRHASVVRAKAAFVEKILVEKSTLRLITCTFC